MDSPRHSNGAGSSASLFFCPLIFFFSPLNGIYSQFFAKESPAVYRKWRSCVSIRSLSFLKALVDTVPSTGKGKLKWPVSNTVLAQGNPPPHQDAMTSEGTVKEVVVVLRSVMSRSL